MVLKFPLPRSLYFELLDGQDAEFVYEFLLWMDEHRIEARLHKDVTERAGAWFQGKQQYSCRCWIEFFRPQDAVAYKLRWY